jgi:hypothetical protein
MICPAQVVEFFNAALETAFWQRVGVLVASAIASFLLGRWLGMYQSRRDWKRKEFLDRLNVSLNAFHDGTLHIRTILERPLDEVFHNDLAVKKIHEACARTTAENPLLPMRPKDCWFLLNFVVNAIAEHFSAGAVRREAGEPVRVVRYALFLTCEVVEAGRIRKVRAMLIRPELLKEFPYAVTMPALERPWHDVRVRTLRQAADLYHKQPDHFVEVEICV